MQLQSIVQSRARHVCKSKAGAAEREVRQSKSQGGGSGGGRGQSEEDASKSNSEAVKWRRLGVCLLSGLNLVEGQLVACTVVDGLQKP